MEFNVFAEPDGSDRRGSTGAYDNAARPQNIDFYVALKAQVIVAKGQQPKYIQFVMSRGSQRRYERGYLITDRRDADHPQDVGDGWLYTYRTHGSRSRTPRLDWNVTKLVGRWQIRVQGHEDETNPPLDFKIDKRSQIVLVARAYAGLGIGGMRYPTNARKPFFSDCFSFTAHVYNRVGLKIRRGTTGTSTDASAPDNGRGAIRFFTLIDYELKPPAFHPNPSHAAIVDGNSQIDENNAVAPNVGPRVRAIDSGVGTKYSSGPKRGPSSRTLPYPGQAGNSLLRGLDSE